MDPQKLIPVTNLYNQKAGKYYGASWEGPDGDAIYFTQDHFKEAGLDNVNGGAAEILGEETRAKICPNKVNSANWLAIHEELHRQGVASNATMLYGHIESLEDRVDHLIRLRESQDRSPGFNAFRMVSIASSNVICVRIAGTIGTKVSYW